MIFCLKTEERGRGGGGGGRGGGGGGGEKGMVKADFLYYSILQIVF